MSALNYYRAAVRVIGLKHFTSEPIRVFFIIKREKILQPKTLIIWGDKDHSMERKCAELSLVLCRDARLEIINDASHWVQQDTPEKVNKLIEEFIKTQLNLLIDLLRKFFIKFLFEKFVLQKDEIPKNGIFFINQYNYSIGQAWITMVIFC